MKTTRFYVMGTLVAGLMMTACSEEELVNESVMNANEKAIGFTSYAKRTTRAVFNNTNVNAKGNTMSVWGYKRKGTTGDYTQVFNEQLVTAGENGTWTYAPARSWDKQATYNFFAVIPSEVAEATEDLADGTAKMTITSIPRVQPTTGTDYLVATGKKGVGQADGTVEFTFNHILSKLNVYAKSLLDDNYTLTIKSLKLYIPDGTATYTQTTAGDVVAYNGTTNNDAWTFAAKEPATNYECAVQTTGISVGETEYSQLTNSYFVAPTPVAANHASSEEVNITMDVEYELAYATEPQISNFTEFYSYTNVPVAGLKTFKQGYNTNLYVFFDISGNKIDFAVETINAWTDASSYINEDGTVYTPE